jgi:ferredoxin-NADP reductase
MKRPKRVESVVTYKNWISEKAIKISIDHVRPQEVPFEAGQFISLRVGEGKYRAYSICSNPGDIRKMDLVADAKHMGVGASYIRNLKLGDIVNFIGPSGKFRLRIPFAENLHFFSTGTGIAPFIAMFHELAFRKYQGKIRLYHGIRHKNDALFLTALHNFRESLPCFDYQIYVSQDENCDKYNQGRITNVLSALEKGDNSHYYLCGNPNMVMEVKRSLLDKGIRENQIFFEGFTYAVS